MTWASEAKPQTTAEVRNAPLCPEVIEAAEQRGITGVVHFTRIRGLVGIMDSRAVKARLLLPEDERLKHVYEENAPDRSRDVRWHGYVNLSVTEINLHMFERSRGWHPDDRWVILDFAPGILGDRGVVFCTTNNAYGEVIHRSAGLRGFEQMFAAKVPWGYHGSVCTRGATRRNQTTDRQAEVLYPFELSLDHLRRIIAGDEATRESVVDVKATFAHCPDVEIVPEAFQ